MTDIVIHGVPGSPFLRAVQMGLEEKQVPHRVKALAPGEMKSEAYLTKHPFGRVPLFEHGDFTLYETQAILRYINDEFPEPPFEPNDHRLAARMTKSSELTTGISSLRWLQSSCFSALLVRFCLEPPLTKQPSTPPCRWPAYALRNWIDYWVRNRFLPATACPLRT